MSPMELRDSRRLPGPSLLLDRPGAEIDVALTGEEERRAVDVWRIQAKRMLRAIGWGLENTAARAFEGGARLAISAPIDALYAATEVNEWAFEATRALLLGQDPPSVEENAARLRARIVAESDPRLVALRDAADVQGVTFITDTDATSIGMGAGSITFSTRGLPDPRAIEWSRVHDIPAALVTGTNGKSTTVRMLGAIAQACDRVCGLSSSDWIRIDGEVVETGDYAGPEGARKVLRDKRVEVAVLETARAGILGRGLAVSRARAAAITNAALENAGEWGLGDIDALIDTKLVVARALSGGGKLVINADDEGLVARARRTPVRIHWFSLDAGNPVLAEGLQAGNEAFALEGSTLVAMRGRERVEIGRVAEFDWAFDGAARQNIANALAAGALASAIGLSVRGIAYGLRAVHSTPAANPGRLDRFDLGGVRCIVDVASNAHAMEALVAMAQRMPAGRRLVILGQAGDRDDASIRELARIAWRMRPERIVIKEMPSLLRGRAAGEVSRILSHELHELGVPALSIVHSPSELEAVHEALRWAQSGDLLLLLLQVERDAVTRLLPHLRDASWEPGRPLPVT